MLNSLYSGDYAIDVADYSEEGTDDSLAGSSRSSHARGLASPPDYREDGLSGAQTSTQVGHSGALPRHAFHFRHAGTFAVAGNGAPTDEALVSAMGTAGSSGGLPVSSPHDTVMYTQENKHMAEKQGYPNIVVFARPLLLLALVFCSSLMVVVAVFESLPPLVPASTPPHDFLSHGSSRDVGPWHNRHGSDEGEKRTLQELRWLLPRDLDDVRQLRRMLITYRQQHAPQMLASCMLFYVFLQAFMIPGSIFLTILCGSLYDFHHALLLCVLGTSMGSSCAYFLSSLILRELVAQFFPERCTAVRREVSRHRSHLLNYVLFLRLVPFTPNWFLNVVAPVVHIPFLTFFWGTLLGVVPMTGVVVKAGSLLSSLQSLRDLYNARCMAILLLMGVLALTPVLLRHRMAERGRRGHHTKHRAAAG